MSAVVIVGTSKHIEKDKRLLREAGLTVREKRSMHLGRGIWMIGVEVSEKEIGNDKR